MPQGPARTFTTMNVWDLRLSRDGHVNLTFDEGHTVAMVILRGTVMANADQVVREGPMGLGGLKIQVQHEVMRISPVPRPSLLPGFSSPVFYVAVH